MRKLWWASHKEKFAPIDETFIRQYRSDWVALVHDCFDWQDDQRPTFYQDEILAAIPKHKRVAVRGPHGLGKTALDSWAILCFALTRDGDDWKIPTTASAWRQLTKYLWPEVHKWIRRIRWDKVKRAPFRTRYELNDLSLKLKTGEAFAVASDNSDLIEGAHADSLLYLFDEAKAIPDSTWDAAEGAFSNAGDDTANEAFALATSTPGETNGRFYDIHKRKPGFEDWWVRHVTLDEAIRAGRISKDWAQQRARQWGETSALYQRRVLGEFAAGDEDGVIPLAWVELANERYRDWVDAGRPAGRQVSVGVDVGAEGDKTVIAPRSDDVDCPRLTKDADGNVLESVGRKLKVIEELRDYAKADTMSTVGRIMGILQARPNIRALIDVIGIGAGVVHRLREMKKELQEASTEIIRWRIVGFGAAEGTDWRDDSGELGAINKRAAAWWNMRQLLDPANDHHVALPAHDLLTGELTTPRYEVRSGGKLKIESKKDIKKRLGRKEDDARSTDFADAVIQAFWDEDAIEAAIAEKDDDKSSRERFKERSRLNKPLGVRRRR